MRRGAAYVVVVLMSVALIPLACADDAALTPEQVMARLQAIVTGGGDGDADFASIGDLMVMPATEEDQELAGYASFIVFTVMMLAEPPQPAVMEGETAVVALQAAPLEFVLVQEEGKWKVDMVATWQRLPEKLRNTMMPELSPEEKAQRNCLSNVKQLGMAAMMYATDHDETLPEADKWMDQLAPYLASEDVYKCPTAPDLEYGYAMNAALSGMKTNQIKDVAATVLFFDSALGTRNASGGPAAVCEPGRHNEGNNYSYVDSHAQWSTMLPSFDPLAERPAPEEGPVLAVTDATFEDEVLKAQGWVLVDMWAEWCPPCTNLKPVFAAMAAEYEGRAKFVSVDTDANPKTAEAYGAPPIPLILLFRDGELVDKQVGFGQEQPFRAWVAGHLD